MSSQSTLSNSEIPIGLIAGWGSFPLQVAQTLRDAGHPVFCLGITDHASEQLESICTDVYRTGVGRLGSHMRYFRRHGVRHVTMAGKLFKAEMLYSGSLWLKHLPDWTCLTTFGPALFGRRRDARDDTLLLAVTNSFIKRGMEVCAATDFAPELLVEKGTLTGAKPSRAQALDIEAGWRVARQMGAMDIGQSITVKDGTVIAVEAIEGTDACIERTGQLCRRGGWTLVKVSKPNQDMRFDVPTIGPQTVEKVHASGGKVIAIEADKTIVVERPETIALARKTGVTIIALDEAEIGLSVDQASRAG
jgi:DUF1009 family protein